MGNIKKRNPIDKKELLRETIRLTMPPRMEGKVKDAGVNPIKKK